jgi:hypothetical protein
MPPHLRPGGTLHSPGSRHPLTVIPADRGAHRPSTASSPLRPPAGRANLTVPPQALNRCQNQLTSQTRSEGDSHNHRETAPSLGYKTSCDSAARWRSGAGRAENVRLPQGAVPPVRAVEHPTCAVNWATTKPKPCWTRRHGWSPVSTNAAPSCSPLQRPAPSCPADRVQTTYGAEGETQ